MIQITFFSKCLIKLHCIVDAGRRPTELTSSLPFQALVAFETWRA